MAVNDGWGAAQGELGAVVVARRELAAPPIGLYAGSIALVLLGLLLAVTGVFRTRTAGLAVGIDWFLFAGPIGAMGGYTLARRAALRCAVTVHERGLVLSREDIDEAIPYAQVRGFSLTQREQLADGRAKGMLHTVALTGPGGKREFAHFASIHEADAFSERLLKHVTSGLVEAARARIAAGTPLEGKGWALDAHGLRIGERAAVPLRELVHIGGFEGKVSFWREGEVLPFFSVAQASPNARLLGLLAERECSASPRPVEGSLGRLLFQKGAHERLHRALAGLFFLLGVVGAIRFAVAGSWGNAVVSVLVCGGVGLGFAAYSLNRFRVYERGVTSRSVLGSMTLHYTELTGFEFDATHTEFESLYIGTKVSLSFLSDDARTAISHSQTHWGNDPDLDALREHVSGLLAGRLRERLERGEEIAWGSTARFTPRGLIVQASSLFGPGEERLVPYGAALHYTLERGGLHLFIGSESQAAMTVYCSETNFYPGLMLLGELRAHGR